MSAASERLIAVNQEIASTRQFLAEMQTNETGHGIPVNGPVRDSRVDYLGRLLEERERLLSETRTTPISILDVGDPNWGKTQ